MTVETLETNKPVISFGPEMPGFGSWDWVGAEIAAELSRDFRVTLFQDQVPECDVVVFVKFKPPAEVMQRVAKHSAVIYCPIDFYGSSGEIDADYAALRHCTRILVHCERLRKYFAAYAPVEYMDHHVKFVTPLREEFRKDGPLLWIGVRTNLPPLVEWVNQRRLEDELWILTNPENETQPMQPQEYGFRSGNNIRMEVWSPQRHLAWTERARVALDIKGDDFRGRHKPPAKALDFIASGIPLAMNAQSSSVEHLDRLGFSLATPDDREHWYSREYWEETVRFGHAIRELLSRERVVTRWQRLIEGLSAVTKS